MRVVNAAIWARVTLSSGPYVVADVPLVSPEKYASATAWQNTEGMLPKSVNGSPRLALHPVWACNRVEVTTMLTTNASNMNKRSIK